MKSDESPWQSSDTKAKVLQTQETVQEAFEAGNTES